MSKQTIIVVILSWISLHAIGQADTSIIRLSGIVNSSNVQMELPYVHIINKRTGMGTITDTMGLFHIKLKQGDTLIFRSIGFEDNVLILNDSINSKVLFMEVELFTKSYQLHVVDVIALTRENQFKYDFLNMNPDESSWEHQLVIPGVTKKNYQWIREEEKFNPKKSFTGPISSLYYILSDKGKSLQKLADLIDQDEQDKKANLKYNLALLADYTGYSDAMLQAFYNYLHLSVDFVLQQRMYDIYLHIQSKIPSFELQYAANDSTPAP